MFWFLCDSSKDDYDVNYYEKYSDDEEMFEDEENENNIFDVLCDLKKDLQWIHADQ